jgi:hypothetical protein
MAPAAAAATTTMTTTMESIDSVPIASPVPMIKSACEMILDGIGCRQRCECEWCPPGPDHGCHAIDLEGPCGGRPGQRADRDKCYDDALAGTQGLIVGALFLGLAFGAVGLWCCGRRILSWGRQAARCWCKEHKDIDPQEAITIITIDAGETYTAVDAPSQGLASSLMSVGYHSHESHSDPIARHARSRPIDMPRPRALGR